MKLLEREGTAVYLMDQRDEARKLASRNCNRSETSKTCRLQVMLWELAISVLGAQEQAKCVIGRGYR